MTVNHHCQHCGLPTPKAGHTRCPDLLPVELWVRIPGVAAKRNCVDVFCPQCHWQQSVIANRQGTISARCSHCGASLVYQLQHWTRENIDLPTINRTGVKRRAGYYQRQAARRSRGRR